MWRSARGNSLSSRDNEDAEAAACGLLRPHLSRCTGLIDSRPRGTRLHCTRGTEGEKKKKERKKAPSPFRSRSSRGTDWEAADRAEGTGDVSGCIIYSKENCLGWWWVCGVQNKARRLIPAPRHAQLGGAGMQNNAPRVR